MRIVFLADTHLGFDYPIKPRIQRRRRGPDFFENFRRVLAYARNTRPDFVVHGGDLFFRARIPQKIIDLVYADLFEFAGEGIPIIIVPGNHERSILPISLFINHPNIYIFDRPKTYEFHIDGFSISLSGFPCERKAAREKFRGLLGASGWYDNKSTLKLLCMHQTIEGAQVGPSNYTFRSGKDVIPRDYLPKDATAILCGHIHRKQVLGSVVVSNNDHPLVIYPGSTERTSFAEKEERKGFYVLEFTEKQETWGLSKLEFIQLPARPMVDLYLDDQLTPDNLDVYIQSQISDMDPESIVRFRFVQEAHPQVISKVTSKYLREMLPETMNYQFSSEFRQRLINQD